MNSLNENNEELRKEIFGDDKCFDTDEEIKLNIIKEQAIILAEEVNQYCHILRNRLKNGQTLGYQDILAKFYYDIAYANYKYYNQILVKDNLLSVKKYLEKSIEQFNGKQTIIENINSIKQAKYLLDSVCDLYLKESINRNNLPFIPGNAVILVKYKNSHDYDCYFVENDCWLEDRNHLKMIRMENLNLDNLIFNCQSGLVIKTERNAKEIEDLTRNAQLKRGHGSINVKYYALKRKRKELERNLKDKIAYALDLRDVEDNSETNFAGFDRVKSSLKNVVQLALNKIGYEGFGISNLPSVVCKLLSELIECLLEIGLIDQAQYYINYFQDITVSDFSSKLNEYQLRKELIVQLREIIDSEIALLSSQQDDIETFLVKKPENPSDYDTEISKWKRNQCIEDNRSVLFIFNCEKIDNSWQSCFWIADKNPNFLKLDVNEKSVLSVFLKHIYYNKTVNLFTSELLDMIADRDNFIDFEKNSQYEELVLSLKSKKTKILQYCNSLKDAYHFLGHYPREYHYQQLIYHFLKEKHQFLKEFCSSYDIHYHSSNSFVEKKQENQFSLGLFPISLGSSIKKLNDKITEKDFFPKILPYIDQIPDLNRSFTSIYKIDWRLCYSQNNKDKFLKKWYKEKDEFQRNHPYEKKCLLLLIECDFYFLSKFDENNLPIINGNAIILTKLPQFCNYKCYFVKDSLWIKDDRIHKLKNMIIENMNLENIRIDKYTGLIDKEKFHGQKSRDEIEKLTTDMNLNRWYFFGETLYERILEGFIDQKSELVHLNIYLKDILVKNFRDENKKIFRNKNKQIINHLLNSFPTDHLNSKDYFLKPIVDKQNLIEIYDLRKSDDQNELKNQIKCDRKRNFTCIIKLSNEFYISLLIESEKPYKQNISIRYIYIINSTFEKHRLKKLKWLNDFIDQCIYKLDFIQCPKQKLMSQDSFLHAYLNASACQWACDNNHWDFLKKHFSYQRFSNKKNIEKIKQWVIETMDPIPMLKSIEDQPLENQNIELLEKFQNKFKETFSLHLNSIETNQINQSIEILIKDLFLITTYDQIFGFIQNMVPQNDLKEIKQCLQDIEKVRNNESENIRETFEIKSIIDSMFSIIQEYSINLLPFQEKISQNFEIFEDKIHHVILSRMTSNNISFNQDKYPDDARRMKFFFDLSYSPSLDNFQISDYLKFTNFFFENFIDKEKNVSTRTNLLSLCENIKKLLEDGTNTDRNATNQMARKSLDNISKFIQTFAKIEKSFEDFDKIFKNLLSYSYEVLDLLIINDRLKIDIYNYISSQKRNFEDIEKSIYHLLDNVKIAFNIKDARKKLQDDIFKSFNDCIRNNDERAIHYIGAYLRQTMMNRVDQYMKSLISFRQKSLASMENFHQHLHKLLVDSIREIIRKKNNTNQIANEIMMYVNSINLEKLDYEQMIDIYKKILEKFSTEKQNLMPKEVIQSLKTQIENRNHSHMIYLKTKINNLIKMLDRFAKLEKVLVNFSELFQQCLSEKYDHLSEQEVFSNNGQIKNEILNRLKQHQHFNDIKEIIAIFQNDQLNNILINCEQFLRDKDEKGSAEISECLRQCILDTTEYYTSNLLTYRHSALVAFNHFEKQFYQLLSTYEAIENKELREFIRERLKELIDLENESDKNYYSRALIVYRRFVDNLDDKYKSCTSIIKDTLDEQNRNLKPYFKGKINNLKNLLNNYINWYQIDNLKENDYEIFQIKTHSAILSDIINVIKCKYSYCFCSNNEIRIINSNKLYIDIDLNSGEYSGVNIVLVSPHQELVNHKNKLVINTDGEDAKNIWENNSAKNGNGTDTNRRGNKGEDGSDGKVGKSAGHVYVVANQLPLIEVSACGGKGGRGQDGGNGAPGPDGEDGKDGDRDALVKKLEERSIVWCEWSNRCRRIGTDGKLGGWGGDSGSGGFRGDGGNPGLIKLFSLNNISPQISTKNLVGEPGNDNGKPGQPGEAGKHGRDGRDYVGLGEWGWLQRTVANIKGGRLHACNRYDVYEERFCNNYPMLSMEDDETHPRFRSKYNDRDAQKGSSMNQAHKNQEIVQKIHGINHQHIFEETSQFFKQFSNPQNLSAYQHWLAPNLNIFLEKMSVLEGLPPCEISSLPDVEHNEKEILILKEKFSQMISIENQKLQTEKFNTDQLGIGIILLEQNILNQYNDFLQQYQIIYNRLQDEIQHVDINQLTTNLEIRNVEIANLRSSLNKIFNERRFNQSLASIQQRTEMFTDMPKEKLSKSISDRQNVQILSENFSKQEWREFPNKIQLINIEIIEKFNRNPSEELLLEIACEFLTELEKVLSETNAINEFDLNKKISNFTTTYLYNLQQSNYNLLRLQLIEKQKQAVYEMLCKFQSLENSSTLDLLIEFFKGIQREYLRQYWLIWTTKTLECQKHHRESEDEYLNILEMLRIADDQQIEQLDFKLKSSSILKEFIYYDFDEKLYSTNRSDLLNSIDNFNEESNEINLIKIFEIFSNSSFFIRNQSDNYQNLLLNIDQLDLINDFLFTFQNNLTIMNMDKQNFDNLTRELIKIEEILIENPHSYFHNIIFNFSILIEQLKLKISCLPDNKQRLDEIYQSKDFYQLLNYQTSKSYQQNKTFTIEQHIDAFHTLYDHNLVKPIFSNLVKSLAINENKLIQFLQWTIDHFEDFDDKTIEIILDYIEVILKKTKTDDIQNCLKFLKLIFDYKRIEFDIANQERVFELIQHERENSWKETLMCINQSNDLFEEAINNDEKAFEFYRNSNKLIENFQIINFQSISNEKCSQLATISKELLNYLSEKNAMNKIFERLKDLLKKMSSHSSADHKQIKNFIDNFQKNKIKIIDYLEKLLKQIDEQRELNRIYDEKKNLLNILEKLFFDIETLDDNSRIRIINKLYPLKVNQALIEKSKFCLLLRQTNIKFEKEIRIHLEKNQNIRNLLEKQLEKFFSNNMNYQIMENILTDIVYPFIYTLNLYKYSYKQIIDNDFLSKTIERFVNIQDKKDFQEEILCHLLDSYPIFIGKLTFIKKYISELDIDKKITNSEVVLNFLYIETKEKSEVIEEIYQRFFDHCQKFDSAPISIENLIKLMQLISRAHQDGLYPDQVNIDHAQFQLILLHTLFENNYPLGILNDHFIEFLFWLFESLTQYNSSTIEIDRIEQLKQLSSKINNILEKNQSHKNLNEYSYLNESIQSIHQEIKSIYIKNSIDTLFKDNSSAKWLEIPLYFSTDFSEDSDRIINLLKENANDHIDSIQKIIFQRISILQKNKLDNFYQLVSKSRQEENSELKNQLEKGFEQINGYINEQKKSSFESLNPYDVLNFNTLIDTFNYKFETDGKLAIEIEIFNKIQRCLSCFEDIRLSIKKLSSSSQIDWLKVVLIEHIIEKFSLIFSHENQIESLRNVLMRINEKLIFLFNNVFIIQYIDQINQAIYSTNNSIPDSKKITKEKFLSIVKLLENIPATQQILDQLSDSSLAIWDTILHEMEFSRIFNIEMSKSGIDINQDKNIEKTLLYLNRIRIQLGTENNQKFLNFLRNICEKIVQTKDFIQLNDFLKNIHYQKISFEEGSEIVCEFDYLEWNKQVEEMCLCRDTNNQISDRSAKEIIDEIIQQQNNKMNNISKEILQKIAEQTERFREKAKNRKVLEGNEKSEIYREIQEIFNQKSYQNNPEEYMRSHLDDIIPLILYTWSIANKPQFPKDTQIIALLLFIFSNDRGLLEQVQTGEGKTLIVGITAAFFALCGYAVDIVSSNRDLAIDGEKKCHSFFHLLKIESDHICSEDNEVNHQSYRPDLNTSHGNIVYGEVGAFQRDILEEEFNNKKIFGKRYLSRSKCLIVDEVDNMCLDRARHVLYLSHEIQSLKWLETLFIFIWTAVLRADFDNPNDISEQKKDISIFMKQNIENKNIFIPDYTKNFVNYKIERWIDSAFQARFMREDDHFVLDISKTDDQNRQKQKTIIVLDKDTGVEQYSTKWSNGLAQFLELKYRRKISVESLKAVFISNKAFFQRYKDRLYGLTGTLGSENSQSFLSDLYQVRFVYLPTSKKKLFYQLASKIAIEYSDWLDLIAKETIKEAEKRPVLIICENVEATENIWNELIRHNVSPHTIEKYRRDGDNVEDRFHKKPATRGDIIIATNKGGRGTDINVDQQVNIKGGMHVILTYLPENIRVEEQAFGRTARNGAQGTGQYILQINNKSIYEDMYEIHEIPSNKQKEKLDDLSDVILERQKIIRDNTETARLSELKQKNILHLEVEEELFAKFNQFKNQISKDVFEDLFKNQSEKSKDKFINVFENVLKNRWAFWLDRAKEDIDQIENSQQKLTLLNKFKLNFIDELTNRLQNASFDDLLKKFINQPEEAIQIGKVCLSENEFLMAKRCFEISIEYGDISAFSYIGFVFSIIHLEQDKTTKKLCRRELKKAIYLLESLKRNLMSNLKIAEHLPQLAADEILKKFSSKENFYEDQITGKLEVIGLHLHYLKQAVGDTIEPFDLIFHPKDQKNLTKDEQNKGKELFDLLVQGQIIQGDQLRKRCRTSSQERKKMERMIENDIDPSIANQLISLLNSKMEFDKKDFEDIVCYNEQLWENLNIQNYENVFTLDKMRIEKELPEKYENIWKDLENQIDSHEVNISLFDKSIETKNLKIFFEEKQILSKTKRVKIEDINLNTLELRGKYAYVKFNDNGHETKDLKTFLIALINEISQNRSYFYQTDLPYNTKEEEGNKIRIYLKEKNILKSGGLKKYKYGNIKENIQETLSIILKDTQFESDKELILSKLLLLQGDIRSYEENLKANLKDFLELKDQENIPNELKFFEGIGLNKFLILTEDKSWWDWNAFAVAMIGLAQIIGGAILISFGLVNIGGVLISEGISDLIYATMASISGNFSWKDWAIQKTISLSISLVTFGIGKLASTGNTIAKVGSVSRTAIFAKSVGKAASQFAVTCLTNILTEKIMTEIQENVLGKVMDIIEQTFLSPLTNSINNKVKYLFAQCQNEQEFEKHFNEMKKDIQATLGRNILLPQQFDNIRIQVMSSLKNSYQIFIDGLKKSNSKYAKIAANAINATIMINQLWDLIEPVLQFKHVYNTFIHIIEGATKVNQNINIDNINQNLVNERAKQLNNVIRQYILNELIRKLDSVLRQIISGALKQIGKSVGQGIKAMMDSEFDGKNPIDMLQQSNRNKKNSEESHFVTDQPSVDQNSNIEENQAKRKHLQNNITNPKEMVEECLKETKDKNRPLDRADIKMLADSERRNIIVYNKDTREKEIFRPSGLGQIPAFFKQSASINYEADENGEIGHYFTARKTEVFRQINGRNDCLLIAYHESLGRKVDENFLEQQRTKLDQYTNRHLDRFVRYRQTMYMNKHNQMIGGSKKQANREIREESGKSSRKERYIDNPQFIEETTSKERKMAAINNNIRDEVVNELWPKVIKKASDKNGWVSVTQRDSSFRDRYETDNVRLDDQGPTGESGVINLQLQIGGKECYYQRRSAKSTTFANLLVTKPTDPNEVYYYRIEDITRGVLEMSLKKGKIYRIAPPEYTDEKSRETTNSSNLKKSNSSKKR